MTDTDYVKQSEKLEAITVYCKMHYTWFVQEKVQYATTAVCCVRLHGFQFSVASTQTISQFNLNHVKRDIFSLLVYKWPLLLQNTVLYAMLQT